MAYNTATKLADSGYKTLLIDADPQCNLTLLWLGAFSYRDLGLFEDWTIYNVVKPLIEWTWDIDLTIQPINLRDNLDILPWNLLFGDFDDTLTTWYSEMITSSSPRRWFMVVSALKRYIQEISIKNWYQVVIIDVSPSLTWSLNKTIIMSSDFFVTICNPDLFSEQWIMNLWEKISKWKVEQWNINTIATRNGSTIPASYILNWGITFLWYIINNHKVYAKKVISNEQEWINAIRPKIHTYLSIPHSRNWLVELSYSEEIVTTQDFSRIVPISQEKNKPLYEVTKTELDSAPWSMELLEKCKSQIDILATTIISRLQKWWV